MDGQDFGGSVIARIALGVGVIALLPHAIGVLLALLAYVLLPRVVRLFESDQARERRFGVDREIALLAQLLSAHLSAGAGVLDAVESISKSLRSQLAPLTQEVAMRLRAGDRDPFEPWRRIPGLVPLADSATRSMRSGSSMATAAERIAERVREREYRSRQSALERAVIRMTLPLGICLLPAFVLTVVIPMAYVLFQGADF